MKKNTESKNTQHIILLLLFSLSQLGYFFLTKSESTYIEFIFLYSAQFIIYGFIILNLARIELNRVEWAILVAILSRILLWFSDPVFENDYWRYLWDGRVLAHGINPYEYSPLHAQLDFLDIEYRHWVGWSQFRTIYPPVAQLIFAGTHLIFPDSLIGLKGVFTLFDVGTGILLMLWLKEKGIAAGWSALYWLNPLLLKEIANSSHLDSIPMFFTFAAFYLMSRSRRLTLFAWLALALAVGAKLYPLVLVPLFARADSRWKVHLGVFVAVLVVIYLPFMGAGWNLLGGTQAYAKYWIFNASVFQLATALSRVLLENLSLFQNHAWLQEALRNDYPAKLILGLGFFGFVVWRARRVSRLTNLSREALLILGSLLIISPVVDAWYVLWVLPFACLERNVPWLAFSYLVVGGSYSWFYSTELSPYFRMIEYTIFFALFLVQVRRQK